MYLHGTKYKKKSWTEFYTHTPSGSLYRVAQKNVYIHEAFRRLRQCLDADGGHFEHLHWIQNSRTSLISIFLLYKYSSYDYRVIFFMSKCVYIILGHSVFLVLEFKEERGLDVYVTLIIISTIQSESCLCARRRDVWRRRWIALLVLNLGTTWN